MRKAPYSSEPLLLTDDQRVWVDWVNGVSVDPVEQHKRLALLERRERAGEKHRDWIANDKDKNWSTCPDPNCETCQEAKRLLLSMLDAIANCRGPDGEEVE